ncbi:MAG: hypothetical protein ABIO99_10180, partial [Candidatus Limnocylindria bacterium]
GQGRVRNRFETDDEARGQQLSIVERQARERTDEIESTCSRIWRASLAAMDRSHGRMLTVSRSERSLRQALTQAAWTKSSAWAALQVTTQAKRGSCPRGVFAEPGDRVRIRVGRELCV